MSVWSIIYRSVDFLYLLSQVQISTQVHIDGITQPTPNQPLKHNPTNLQPPFHGRDQREP